MRKNTSLSSAVAMLFFAVLVLAIPSWFKNYDGLSGYVLIATPELDDPNFRQTVILITEHNLFLARGYVLNRRQPEQESKPYQRWGGPLAPEHVRILTSTGGQKSTAVPNTLLYTRLPDPLYDRSEDDIFLHGYAAWSWTQLEDEIEAEKWKIRLFTPDILDIPLPVMWEDLWAESL